VDIVLLVVHVFLSLGIITLVLLQKGAGASAGAAFGGGGAGSVFGATGSANFLSKTTAIFAIGFFVNSLVLAYLAAHRDVHTDSVLDALTAPQTEVSVPADGTPAADTETTGSVPAETSDIPPADVPAAEGAPATETDTPTAAEDAGAADVPPPAGE
jgi:preprotein translocase subunit SecG